MAGKISRKGHVLRQIRKNNAGIHDVDLRHAWRWPSIRVKNTVITACMAPVRWARRARRLVP